MFSSQVDADPNQEKTNYLFVKGAESVILPNCVDGPIEETYEIVDQFATEGLRTLVYAYKTLTHEELKGFNENLERAKQNMTDR